MDKIQEEFKLKELRPKELRSAE